MATAQTLPITLHDLEPYAWVGRLIFTLAGWLWRWHGSAVEKRGRAAAEKQRILWVGVGLGLLAGLILVYAYAAWTSRQSVS